MRVQPTPAILHYITKPVSRLWLLFWGSSNTSSVGYGVTSHDYHNVESCYPHICLRSTDELLELRLCQQHCRPDNHPLCSLGWAEVQAGSQPELLVPVAEPLGCNMIEHLVKSSMEQHSEGTSAVVREAFSINCEKTKQCIDPESAKQWPKWWWRLEK